MAHRAGRGAQLLKALEAQKQAKAEEAKQIEECAKNGIEHPRVTLARGRAALMEQLRKPVQPVAVGSRPAPRPLSSVLSDNESGLDPMTSSSDSR